MRKPLWSIVSNALSINHLLYYLCAASLCSGSYSVKLAFGQSASQGGFLVYWIEVVGWRIPASKIIISKWWYDNLLLVAFYGFYPILRL